MVRIQELLNKIYTFLTLQGTISSTVCRNARFNEALLLWDKGLFLLQGIATKRLMVPSSSSRVANKSTGRTRGQF